MRPVYKPGRCLLLSRTGGAGISCRFSIPLRIVSASDRTIDPVDGKIVHGRMLAATKLDDTVDDTIVVPTQPV